MSSVNKVILVGRLGSNPEKRYFANGDAVCNLSLATSTKWRDKASGTLREATEWHRLVMFRHMAETAAEFLKKGSCICVEGRLRSRTWTDRDGVVRVTAEIEVTQMQMLGASRSTALQAPVAAAPAPQARAQQGAQLAEVLDEEPPF
jgi:single-strand DNA-binding protein